jgi:membrane fusion protein, multidrug efflux system
MALALAGCGARAEPESVPPPPVVTVTAARKMNVPIEVSSNGTTRALRDVTIRARVKGFLKGQLFQEGSNVKEGQLLFVIDEEPFRVKLEEAQAKLAEAEAALKRAEQSKIREIAQAQLELSQAQLLLAQAEEKRERALFARRATSQEEVDQKDAARKKSAAQVEADKAHVEQARSDYENNILTAQANVEMAKAEVKAAQIDLGYCRMVAPIDGRIGEALVKVGNLVGASDNTALATIQQLDPMGVDLRPSARYLPEITQLIASGLEVNLIVEGDRAHPHAGKVFFVDNTVDPTTLTVLVKAEIPNPEETLLPGEYVQSKSVIGEYRDAVVVPERAVIESQAGPTVFVVDAQNNVVVTRVKVLDTYQGMRVLESGLEPGQNVIVEGIQLVRPGMTVKTEPADEPSAWVPDSAKKSTRDSPARRIGPPGVSQSTAVDEPQPPAPKAKAETKAPK